MLKQTKQLDEAVAHTDKRLERPRSGAKAQAATQHTNHMVQLNHKGMTNWSRNCHLCMDSQTNSKRDKQTHTTCIHGHLQFHIIIDKNK